MIAEPRFRLATPIAETGLVAIVRTEDRASEEKVGAATVIDAARARAALTAGPVFLVTPGGG